MYPRIEYSKYIRSPSTTSVSSLVQDLAQLPLAECAPTGAAGFQPTLGSTLPNAEVRGLGVGV